MKPVFLHLELILTAAGVVVVFVVFCLFRNASPWRAAALCAVAIGVVHGVIFYGVRARQRNARNSEVFSIRAMLDDMVNNRLDMVLYPPQPEDDWRTRAQLAVWEIQTRLNFIENESLKPRTIDPQT